MDAARSTPLVEPRRLPIPEGIAPLLALACAIPLALFVQLVNASFASRPMTALIASGIVLASVMVVPAGYVIARPRAVNPSRLGLLVASAGAVALVAVYLYRAAAYIRFPGDFLIWSESDFVNDILKFRVGYPLYTPDVNNESFTYVPGPQLLTYAIAWAAGHATSVPAYRAIQLVDTLVASAVALACVRQVIAIGVPGRRARNPALWGALWLPMLFLVATNSLTNPFVDLLHDDALAQLMSVVAYWLVLKYVARPERRLLACMALLPAVGFFVKQSLIAWAAFYLLQLLLFDERRSLRRAAVFGVASFALIAAAVCVSLLLWGSPFFYWIFTVLGRHAVSPLRSLQHVFDAWTYFGVGLLGGVVLLRGRAFRRLLGPWVIWLGLLSLEAYSSGIAWMLNHMGPGSLIAGVWFCAALVRLWPATGPSVIRPPLWLRSGVGVAVLALLSNGLGLLRLPLDPIGGDAYRYVADIEREFRGEPEDRVLLDMGSWVYLDDGIVMKDRAPSIGERGYSQTGDFSGIRARLASRYYTKILVRELHSPDFWYDDAQWQVSSGIRQALLENYEEVGQIPAAQAPAFSQDVPYGLSEISVLRPKGS